MGVHPCAPRTDFTMATHYEHVHYIPACYTKWIYTQTKMRGQCMQCLANLALEEMKTRRLATFFVISLHSWFSQVYRYTWLFPRMFREGGWWIGIWVYIMNMKVKNLKPLFALRNHWISLTCHNYTHWYMYMLLWQQHLMLVRPFSSRASLVKSCSQTNKTELP